MATLRGLFSDARLWLVLALPVLLVGVLLLPLWLPEILQLIGTTQRSPLAVLDWVKATPRAAPLGYFTQYLVVAVLGHSAWAARLPSVIFGLASCYLLWLLAKRIGIQHPILALVLFLLLPIHYRFEVEATVFEQALFFSLVAALFFRQVVEKPTVASAFYYTIALTLCLYTEPLSFLPAAGWMLFLLLFIARKERRLALWHVLPATALPILLYAPFFTWARRSELQGWLLAHDVYSFSKKTLPLVFRDLTGGGDAGYALTAIFLIGVIIAVWRAFRYTEAAIAKRVAMFCLLGGVVSTVALVLVIDNAAEFPFSPSQFLWAAPGLVLLMTAALDWLAAQSKYLAYPLAAVLIAICAVGDYTLVTTRTEDVAKLTAEVDREVTGDSCIVFLSEGLLTHQMFAVFDSTILTHECANFFHRRVVLLSHPYVRAEQQRDGETYFHGLDFVETKRVPAGDGLVVVFEPKAKQPAHLTP